MRKNRFYSCEKRLKMVCYIFDDKKRWEEISISGLTEYFLAATNHVDLTKVN